MKQFIKEVDLEIKVKNIPISGFIFSVFTNDKGDAYLSDIDIEHNVSIDKVKEVYNDTTFQELILFEIQKHFSEILNYIYIEGFSDLSNQTDFIFNLNTQLKDNKLNQDILKDLGFSSI